MASMMDFHSRKIIGYAYSKSMTAELATKAVENVCIVLQSDLDTQYASRLFYKISSWAQKMLPMLAE